MEQANFGWIEKILADPKVTIFYFFIPVLLSHDLNPKSAVLQTQTPSNPG